MNKNKLGKGLATLISETNISVASSSIEKKNDLVVTVIPIKDIVLNPEQPRKIIINKQLSELTESVKDQGIIQPLLVRKLDNSTYQIIAGERRYHAAKQAGLTEVPVMIKKVNEIHSFELAVIENIQREDLNVIEEANAYQKLINEHGHTQDTVAKKLGKSRSYIANIMRLLKLPEEVKQMVIDNRITPAHARTIITSEDPINLAYKIINQRLSVRETEKLIKGAISEGSIREKSTLHNYEGSEQKDIIQTEKLLGRVLNANVKIKNGNNSTFTILIKCYGLEELDSIISKLNKDDYLDL